MRECCVKSNIRKDIANHVCVNCSQTFGQIFYNFQAEQPIGNVAYCMKECCSESDIRKDIANYVCVNCGQTSGQVFCHFQSYNLNCNDYRKKKAIHSRTRWFRNMLTDYVYSNKDRDLINALARCYEKHNLLDGRNLSVTGIILETCQPPEHKVDQTTTRCKN